MFGKKSKKALRNEAPSGYWCPICGSTSIKKTRDGMWSSGYVCNSCGVAFNAVEDLSPEDYADEVENLNDMVTIDWRQTSSPMYVVREVAIRNNPKIAKLARDPEIFSWICDYWSYVQWNEHGNEISYEELAEEGYFESILNEITYDPSELKDYIIGDGVEIQDQKRLLEGLERISKRCSR